MVPFDKHIRHYVTKSMGGNLDELLAEHSLDSIYNIRLLICVSKYEISLVSQQVRHR